MRTETQVCGAWPNHEIVSFIRAVHQAKEAVKPRNALLDLLPYGLAGGPRVGLGALGPSPELLLPAQAAHAEHVSEAFQRATEILSAEPLWRRLHEDENFRVLYQKVKPRLDPTRPIDELSFFEAVALGILAERAPRKDADKRAREKAARLTKQLMAMRAEGIRLSSYADDKDFWRLLENLVHEVSSAGRKPREDARRRIRDALDTFVSLLFHVIPPEQVSASMICAYAAVLGDTAERETERQLAKAKKDWTRRLAAARVEALRKPRGLGRVG